jgi:hypothetical protein
MIGKARVMPENNERAKNLLGVSVSHRDSCFMQADFLYHNATVFHGGGPRL